MRFEMVWGDCIRPFPFTNIMARYCHDERVRDAPMPEISTQGMRGKVELKYECYRV